MKITYFILHYEKSILLFSCYEKSILLFSRYEKSILLFSCYEKSILLFSRYEKSILLFSRYEKSILLFSRGNEFKTRAPAARRVLFSGRPATQFIAEICLNETRINPKSK